MAFELIQYTRDEQPVKLALFTKYANLETTVRALKPEPGRFWVIELIADNGVDRIPVVTMSQPAAWLYPDTRSDWDQTNLESRCREAVFERDRMARISR